MSDIRRIVMIDVGDTDWELLAEQKDLLIRLADHNRGTQFESLAMVDGLLAFLDHIQDQAALLLGEDVVFPNSENDDDSQQLNEEIDSEEASTVKESQDRAVNVDGINAQLDRIGTEIARAMTGGN